MNFWEFLPDEEREEKEGEFFNGHVIRGIPIFFLYETERKQYHLVRFATAKEVREEDYCFETDQGFCLVDYQEAAPGGLAYVRTLKMAHEWLNELETHPELFVGHIE